MAQGNNTRKPLFSKFGGGFLRFLWRYWALLAIAILGLLAGWTGYQMWKTGFPAAMARLPLLVFYLALIVVILVIKYALKRYAKTAIKKGKASLQKKVAKEVVEESLDRAGDLMDQGMDRAGDAVQKGVSAAKDAISDLGREVQDTWGSSHRPTFESSTTPQALRCPACGHAVRRGARFCAKCGAPLSPTCPKCGRKLRPGAKFCDGCGEVVRPSG